MLRCVGNGYALKEKCNYTGKRHPWDLDLNRGKQIHKKYHRMMMPRAHASWWLRGY